MEHTYELRLVRIRRIAALMDTQFQVLGVRFGLDSIAGLVPGLGDILTGLVALYIIYEAYRMQVPDHILNTMVRNVIIDVAAGSVPLFGDLFDIFFKANERNVRLIEMYLNGKN